MSESILQSIKKDIGFDRDYIVYDYDLIRRINSTMMTLMQVGVGPPEGFSITGYDETWEDYLGPNLTRLNAVKDYIYIKTRIIFDPPANSFIVTALNDQAKEYEWRFAAEHDSIVSESEVNQNEI